MHRVIVCGGREFRNRQMIEEVLDLLSHRFGGRGYMVVHGDCRGADRLAAIAAERRGIRTEAHPIAAVDWGRYGAGAGPIRNRKMLSLGADLVVAFPGGRGTDNMATIAEDAGVEVWHPGMWDAEDKAIGKRSYQELLSDDDDDTIIDIIPTFDE